MIPQHSSTPAGGKAAPFWSVMMPTYNAGSYFREALRSVLSQDPGPEQMQIEVMDDCSPDINPEPIIREMAGDRVSFFRHEKNLGLCGNWNSCIERARGEWIHILHQDDRVLPGFYQRLRAGIEAHPEAGAAFCRHTYIGDDGTEQYRSLLHQEQTGLLENALELLFSYQRIQCASIVVRRTTYEKLGRYNPEFLHALDWEMWIRIAASFPILYEPQMLACYRTHGASKSTSQFRTGENTRDTGKVIRYCKRYLPPEKAEELARETLHIYATEALERAYALIWKQRDYATARAQAKAALHCELSLRTLGFAALIWVRSFEQEMRVGHAPGS